VSAKCWGNVTRWSVAIGASARMISNMMRRSHVTGSVFERDVLRVRGMQIGAEQGTSRRAAGAWGVVPGVGRYVAGPGGLVPRRGWWWVPGCRRWPGWCWGVVSGHVLTL
jgi:hypothetical protein